MNADAVLRRPIKREAWCRLCQCDLFPGTPVVTWDNYRMKQPIVLCLPCAQYIGQLAR